MKQVLVFIISCLVFNTTFAQKAKTEIYIIGNIHDSVPNYTPQILFNIIDKIKPDIILHEVDSEGMKDYQSTSSNLKGNEIRASNLYLKQNPTTLRFPFDFEGRNQYRKDRGMVPTDNLTFRLIDSLYKDGKLTTQEADIYQTYNNLTAELLKYAALSAKDFNNPKTDSLAKKRQHYQYQEILQITDARPEFVKNSIIKPNGEKISYRDGFKLMSAFWDLRNQTMAKNIYQIAQQHPNKKIVVLSGFLHRYYLINELSRLNKGNYVIKEFYQ